MATLQNIRNRAGLLVAIVIGLALFAFILGDMTEREWASMTTWKGKRVSVNSTS
jgi:hypothetical protein